MTDPRALPKFFVLYTLMRRSIRTPKIKLNNYNLKASRNRVHPDNFDVDVMENGVIIESYRDLYPEEMTGVTVYWT